MYDYTVQGSINDIEVEANIQFNGPTQQMKR